MKTLILILLFVLPETYCCKIEQWIDDSLCCEELKDSLSMLCRGGVRYNYGKGQNSTWAGFYLTDRNADNSVIDLYSPCIRYFSKQGESVGGMHIEHVFPKSWWGGEVNDAYKDLHHLLPADGSANTSKKNWPPGEVLSPTLDNGVFRTGSPRTPGCKAQRVFEPADSLKGDFARMYFYIATVYQDYLWQGTPADKAMDNSGWQEFQPWLRDLLIRWHQQDPVSEREQERQEKVYQIQGNRNPFIDYPELVLLIWKSP